MKHTPTKRRLSQWEINAHLPLIKGWTHKGPQLTRTFTFRNFAAAAKFVGKMVKPAEKLGHHPDVNLQYKRVVVTLTTHELGGVSELDVELARHINKIKG